MDFGLSYAVAGLVVGFAVGLTGIGGGALMTPLLHLGFGVPITTAVGTDLFYAALTKSSSVYVHGRAGTVDWRIVALLAAGSVPGAVLTVLAVKLLGLNGEHFESLILGTLSAAVLATAALILLRAPLTRLLGQVRFPRCLTDSRCRSVLTVIGGLGIGVLVTLTSVGAGVLGTTLVLLLYPAMTAARVVGTELAHAVPLTLVAGFGHLSLGTVDFALLGSLLLGSIPGAYFGSRLGTRLSDRVLRPVLAVMLGYIGWRLGFA